MRAGGGLPSALGRLKDRLLASQPRPESEDLFAPRFFARLDRLRLRVSGARGARSGETVVRGLTQESGIEIESYKSYTPGDDIRYLDWNAVARLDQLLTRRFVAEREIPVHLLVDASASMGVPAADGKFDFARRLTAALAYIALNTNDPVRVAAFAAGAEGVTLTESPLLRHRGRYRRLEPFFAALGPGGGTALREGVDRYLERHHERGLAFVISDFLVKPEDYEDALLHLRARRVQVVALHVVGREESGLGGLRGRLHLRDAESGGFRDVTLGESDRQRYRESFAARGGALRDFCHRHRIGYSCAPAADGVERILTGPLAADGRLRLR